MKWQHCPWRAVTVTWSLWYPGHSDPYPWVTTTYRRVPDRVSPWDVAAEYMDDLVSVLDVELARIDPDRDHSQVLEDVQIVDIAVSDEIVEQLTIPADQFETLF